MVERKILTYCEGNCCETGCFGEDNVKLIAETSSLPYEKATEELAIRYGVKMLPSTLFLKNNALVKIITGKCMKGEIEQTLKSLRWA